MGVFYVIHPPNVSHAMGPDMINVTCYEKRDHLSNSMKANFILSEKWNQCNFSYI